MNKKVVTALIALSLLTLTTLTVSDQIRKTQTIQSKADTINIPAPYIRLSTAPNVYNPGDVIPVDVFVSTAGIETVENRFVVSYDKNVLSLKADGIQNQNIYPVINIEKNVPGNCIFSVFVKNEAGYSPVALSAEKKVATLNFKAVKPGSSNITLDLGSQNHGSGIFSVPSSPENRAVNILKSNQGINITVK